ncbi:MAG: excinuclease ABC subunit A, partial [Deltaproteobacteria bacterium]|nr:excinuclease ABC subunit A [Deltaproteobacteria bacterium]
MKIPNIKITGACQNNLKNLDLEIPLNRITAITGVSGSGKSSLAFDTLYAEGQRRYVETFSPYARQFMDRMDRPRVKRIEGIPPAIAIDRKDPVRTSRSTVGTMTEITDYVKLLFARIASLNCSQCGRSVASDSPRDVWRWMETLAEGSPVVMTFPAWRNGQSWDETRKDLRRLGFDRIYVDGRVIDSDTLRIPNDSETPHILVDRIKLKHSDRQRVMDAVEMAFRFGQGRMNVFVNGDSHAFSDTRTCAHCQIDYQNPTPNLFSFNSPIGACPVCRGFGRVIDIDLDLIIP